MDLEVTLQQIASRYNYKLEAVQPAGTFRMDVSLPVKDKATRFQFVYIWIITEHTGRQRIYMNSRVGMFTPQLNLYNIITEASYCNYSSITIVADKTADGAPCETIVVQAVPTLAQTTPDVLGDIIYEVAVNADILEEKYFGGDKN